MERGETPASRGTDAALALAFVAVILFGATLRVVELNRYPPGLFFDEAANLFDVTRVLQGWRPIYFPANNGREPFFFYWASLFAALWGPTAYALRLAAAVIGTLTIAATFACAREFFRAWGFARRRADWAALGASFVLAVTYMHLHFSRFGLRTVSLPFFLALSLGLLLRGLRRGSWWSLAAAGLCGGLSIYTYLSARVAPALLAVPPVALARQRRTRWALVRVLFVGAIWLAVSAPLGIYALRNPQDVQGHTDDVSILNPVNSHGDTAGAVAHGVVSTLLAIDFVGSATADQNLPGRPILDPLQSLFFVAGLLVLGAGALLRGSASREARAVGSNGRATGGASSPDLRPVVAALLVFWIFDQLATSALAVDPPGFVRITGILPALAIVVAFGLDAVARVLGRRATHPALGVAVVGGALAVTTVLTVRDYFFVYGPSPAAYMFMMGHKVDSAAELTRLARRDRVFLAPLYAQDNTIRYLTQGAPIESFDLGLSLVVPTDRSRDVDYLFPANEPTESADVARELPPGFQETTLRDPTGRFALLTRLTLPASALPAAPSQRLATFYDGIALVDADLATGTPRAGQPLGITLRWLDLTRQPEDYTAFIHLRDAASHTVGQADRQPTAGSFPTSAWQPGDLVVDRYSLSLPASLAPGRYRLVAGLYHLKTLSRLGARLASGDAPNAEVPIGSVEIAAR